jgi:hypothetical protein
MCICLIVCVCFLIVCDLETTKMRRPSPKLGCCATENEKKVDVSLTCPYSDSLGLDGPGI